jgi:hypothetical protein
MSVIKKIGEDALALFLFYLVTMSIAKQCPFSIVIARRLIENDWKVGKCFVKLYCDIAALTSIF